MLAHRIGALLAAAAMAAEGACATQTPPQPPPAPPPDASQKLVDDLTQWLHLDTPQQEKTRQLAREMQKRNEKIQQRWQETHRARPEELAASSGQFQKDFFEILTPEQKQIYRDTALKVMMKGRTAPKSPS